AAVFTYQSYRCLQQGRALALVAQIGTDVQLFELGQRTVVVWRGPQRQEGEAGGVMAIASQKDGQAVSFHKPPDPWGGPTGARPGGVELGVEIEQQARDRPSVGSVGAEASRRTHQTILGLTLRSAAAATRIGATVRQDRRPPAEADCRARLP